MPNATATAVAVVVAVPARQPVPPAKPRASPTCGALLRDECGRPAVRPLQGQLGGTIAWGAAGEGLGLSSEEETSD